MVSPEHIAWTRDVLERVYDLSYLQRNLDSISTVTTTHDAKELQTVLLRYIQQLKPTPDVSPSSLAWRMYNALDHRYLRGLTQTEAAAELNISLRQLRREQDRGIEAVATLFFTGEHHAESLVDENGNSSALKLNPTEKSEFLRLDDLLHAVLSLIDPLLSQKNVDVRVILPPQTPVLWINRTLIRQLLIMVVSSTIHNAADGTLTICSEMAGDRVRLIFVFSGSQAALMGEAENSLETMHQLAQQAGITLTISDDPQAAAQVILSIPVSARQRIMMIDDSLDAIELTRRYLAGTQFDVIAISRTEEALIQAQTLQPSCILLDVMMPGRDGWEMLALLKSHPAITSIPVIVCSVLRNQELAVALGATAVLPRPHTAQQLIALLQTITGQPHQPQAAQS
jgi:CheY-like chemotaxis protein